jgi:pimeloyl-ACP methyl ester carboxylesterase
MLLLLLFGVPGWSATTDNPISFGDNPSAGHYQQVGDAEIYYETYGSGPPLVLLHRGLYGYIDEFSGVIPELSQHHSVIAIALRGHGKSEFGRQPLSNTLFADAAATVVRHVTSEPPDVVSFSVGAMAAYLLAFIDFGPPVLSNLRRNTR